MARVQLVIGGSANRLTLKVILEAQGHVVAAKHPDLVIAEDAAAGILYAREYPTLVLATASTIRDAVAAMRKGVYGYLFVPFQPGEAAIMIERALQISLSAAPVTSSSDAGEPVTIQEVEARHIEAVLRYCKNNRVRAAKLLGIGRNTLWRKLKQREKRP